MQTMSSEVGTTNTQQAVALANSLSGSNVQVSNNGEVSQGLVQQVFINGSQVTVQVNGQNYDSSQIVSISK